MPTGWPSMIWSRYSDSPCAMRGSPPSGVSVHRVSPSEIRVTISSRRFRRGMRFRTSPSRVQARPPSPFRPVDRRAVTRRWYEPSPVHSVATVT